MGEAKRKAMVSREEAIALDTFGGRIHVEWNPAAAVTPLGQLPFFIEFLKVSGVFDSWVSDCPLIYTSNNASDKREVLATLVLSMYALMHDDLLRKRAKGPKSALRRSNRDQISLPVSPIHSSTYIRSS